MNTRIIYLNEEDKPQEQKPLNFVEWLKENTVNFTLTANIWIFDDKELNSYSVKWRDYHNNFKSNDQPIEFTERWDHDRRLWFSKHLNYEPKDFKLIVVSKNDYGTFFDCYLENDCHSFRFKGDLNSGKL